MTTDTLTITLTGRPPVKIKKAEWPYIATATRDWDDDRSGTGTQANREKEYRLNVVRHADGRYIVWGRYKFDSAFQDEEDESYRRGELVPSGEDVIPAIQRVGQDLDECVQDGVFDLLVHECIANLPAQEL